MSQHYRKLENMYLSAPLNQVVYKNVKINITQYQTVIEQLCENKFFHAAQSLHGSVYFKLLDDAAYFAASALITDCFLYTVNFQIQIVRPVKTGMLHAEGKIIKPGNNVVLSESRLYDAKNRLLAIGSGQFMKSSVALSSIESYNK